MTAAEELNFSRLSLSALQFLSRIKGDLTYALFLIICLACSMLLRRWGTRRFDGFIGVGITLVTSGWLALCSLLVVAAHLFLYRRIRNPKLLTDISFYGTFSYLALLRMMHFVGLPPLTHITNAIQLIMTLRVIGLSYEIADSRNARRQLAKKAADAEENLEHPRVIDEPDAFEAFNYLYSFVGIFTGPYYTYQTFADSVHFGVPSRQDTKALVHEKIRRLYWSLPLLLAFTWLGPVDALRGVKINDYSLLMLFIWSALAFAYFRMRIYSAWMVAESICIVAGIGVYPSRLNARTGNGPKALSPISDETANDSDRDGSKCGYDAQTISNLDIPQIEHSDGFRSGMRAWNKTVQFWLAYFVYKRSNKLHRMPYTMLVSAFWHGIHPGYFLSFLTIPLCTTAEDLVFEVFPERPFWFGVWWSFIRTRGFEMMACGFLLLTWSDTIRLWSNQYFYFHVIMVATIIASKVYLCRIKRSSAGRDGLEGVSEEKIEKEE